MLGHPANRYTLDQTPATPTYELQTLRRVLLDALPSAHYFGHESVSHLNEETATVVEQIIPGVYCISWGAVNAFLRRWSQSR